LKNANLLILNIENENFHFFINLQKRTRNQSAAGEIAQNTMTSRPRSVVVGLMLFPCPAGSVRLMPRFINDSFRLLRPKPIISILKKRKKEEEAISGCWKKVDEQKREGKVQNGEEKGIPHY
jgi:hypothetical protein